MDKRSERAVSSSTASRRSLVTARTLQGRAGVRPTAAVRRACADRSGRRECVSDAGTISAHCKRLKQEPFLCIYSTLGRRVLNQVQY